MGGAMTLPELGPLLGSLVEPENPASSHPELEALRIRMVGSLFEQAGQARRQLEAGDPASARTALGSKTWLELWESTVQQAALALARSVEQRIRAAAAYSRYPRKRIHHELPTTEDRRILAARLSAAGIGLESAAPALDGPAEQWPQAIRVAAGELEQAWRRMVVTADQELAFWSARAQAVRTWSRPRWPVLMAFAGTVVLMLWVGLMLGGYLPVPGPLRPAAEWVWSLGWL
jgi:hypothetical protein